MSRLEPFFDWCQRPSKIRIRTFNPRNVMVLITVSIILASSITFGAWRYQVVSVPTTVPEVPGFTVVAPESIETLTITMDTTLTEDYFGNIVIDADGVTLDGNGHMVIGPGTDFLIWDPNTKVMSGNFGILLKGRTGVTVKNCHVTGFDDGFWLDGSDGNTLQENTVTNYTIGFVLSSSSNNIFLNNTANGKGAGDDLPNGFQLGRAFGNTLQGNTVNGNGIGFALEESDDNIFFHNNLIDNTIQAAFQPGDSNTWDNGYSSGGNYWSDYQGVDANGDGIADTPYVIDENNMDRFPLTAPTSVFNADT
jgi:parallel beta-helix repeat protein